MAALSLCLSLPGFAQADQIRRNVAYGPHPDNVLDLCLPDDTSTAHAGVVIIHGGGWIEGDKDGMEPGCRSLAAKGVIGVNINYRLARSGDPASLWPAQLADSQLAVRWMRAHAAELGLDKRRICAWGLSAGGQLALMLGVRRTSVASDEASILGDQSPAVTCVVSGSGPTDLTTVGPPFVDAVSAGLFGGVSLNQNRRLFESASPALLVVRGDPPMLLLHGTKDPVVPYSQATELVAVAHRNAVPVKLVTYDGGHLQQGLSHAAQMTNYNQTIQFLLDRTRLRKD